MVAQEDALIPLEDFVQVVSVLEQKVTELEDLSNAWRLIAESLLGVQKEY